MIIYCKAERVKACLNSKAGGKHIWRLNASFDSQGVLHTYKVEELVGQGRMKKCVRGKI